MSLSKVRLVQGAPKGTLLLAATKMPHQYNPDGTPPPPRREYVALTLTNTPPSLASSSSPHELTTRFARAFFDSSAFRPQASILRAVGLRNVSRDFAKGDQVFNWEVEDRRATEILLRWTFGVNWLGLNVESPDKVTFMFGSALFNPWLVSPLVNAMHNRYAEVLLRSGVERMVGEQMQNAGSRV